ncbi:MAG: hypothetical protein ACLGHE_10630 [Gammaproteobacteria bacterium]
MNRIKRAVLVALCCLPGGVLADPKPVEISETSFKCLSDMTPVRGFFVDNLIGDMEGTLKVANSATGGVYPPGSVVQLVPTEVMVKRETGFSPVTKDWEFFELDVNKQGSVIRKRGFADVNNRFGKNCFACHLAAKPEWDMICEKDHGCEELPIPQHVITALQKTDPRCKVSDATALQRFTSWMVQKLSPE